MKTEDWIPTKEQLPKKPGIKGYEHVMCLVTVQQPNRAPSVHILAWNCEHLCWDDEDGDDYSSFHPYVTAWKPLPEPYTV